MGDGPYVVAVVLLVGFNCGCGSLASLMFLVTHFLKVTLEIAVAASLVKGWAVTLPADSRVPVVTMTLSTAVAA